MLQNRRYITTGKKRLFRLVLPHWRRRRAGRKVALQKSAAACRIRRAALECRFAGRAMAKPAHPKPKSKGKTGESVRTLISREEIQRRVAEMAAEIRRDFPTEFLHLVGVLKGSVFFLTDLARQMSGDVSMDFIAVSSYGSGTHTSGEVKLTRDLDSSIEGKTVVVVEDILDTGMTLQYLLR